MSILGNRRNKGSGVFQGKFGETWTSEDGLDDVGTDGLGFAEKAAKRGRYCHALRCTSAGRPIAS